MKRFITNFDTTAELAAFSATTDFGRPHISLTKDNNDITFFGDPCVVAKFNVTTDTKTQMILGYRQTGATASAVTTAFTRVYVDENEIEISDANVNYTFDTVGEHTVKYELKDPTKIEMGAFSGQLNGFKGVNAVSITIPNSVTSIGNYAFNTCSGLTSITIPNSVTSIGDNAFNRCTSITSCTIGSGVTSIGTGAFSSTPWWGTYSADTSHHYGNIIYINDIAYVATSKSITSATFKSKTVSIGNYAFESCSGLTSIDILDSVTSIGSNAFANCTGITSCTIGSGVTSISGSAFSSCKSLTSVTIPNSVTSIGDCVFYNCSGLTSVTIPNSVTSIGNLAFNGCSGLTSVNIPSGVTSIGSSAFLNCTSITSIVSYATIAPTIQSNTFQNVKTGGTLTVPSGSSGYNVWMGNGNYYLGKYNWTKVEQ